MTTPQLAAPGKGLPTFERFFLKHFYMPRLQKKYSWEESDKKFHCETERILVVAEPLTHRKRQTRVLIPRLRGLEDSSRYWSVNLTLEHLMVVTKGMCDIIVQLSQGKPFPHAVRVQNVKPHGILDEEGVTLFRSCMTAAEDYLLKHIENRESKITHDHPWFGPLTAHGWHTVLGVHHALHRAQIEKIAENLNQSDQ